MTTNLLDNSGDLPELDPTKNYLEELVGEGKKFKTVEDLAKGKYMADIHAKTLEQRMDEMRVDYLAAKEEAQTGRKVAELLDKLDSTKNLQIENTHSNEETLRPDFDEAKLNDLVSSRFNSLKQAEKEEANVNLVMSKVKERFGSNFKASLKEQSEQLGLTEDDVNLMARKNPNLFMKTFDLAGTQTNDQFQPPPRSALAGGFAPKTTKRTMSYYQDLRRKDPMLYYDSKIAVQMDKDAQLLGKEFFDT